MNAPLMPDQLVPPPMADTQRRVVATLPGSLPGGGTVLDTPIHAFAQTPAELVFSDPTQVTVRDEIDCDGALAFLIRNVVSPEEAQELIRASELFGFRSAAPGIVTPPGMRMNTSVHWVADEQSLGPIFQRIRDKLPQKIDGRPLSNRLSHRLNVYKYDYQDVFNRHIDGDWPGFGLDDHRQTMTQWAGVHSCLSMLLYLNGEEDGVSGGRTRLLGRQGTVVDVAPKKGDALFFRHGFGPDSVPHEGRRVTGPVPKYLARINVLYCL
jgi:hypothetical protein